MCVCVASGVWRCEREGAGSSSRGDAARPTPQGRALAQAAADASNPTIEGSRVSFRSHSAEYSRMKARVDRYSIVGRVCDVASASVFGFDFAFPSFARDDFFARRVSRD